MLIDAFNHLWNQTSPYDRSFEPKKPKKPTKLVTPDDFMAESFFLNSETDGGLLKCRADVRGKIIMHKKAIYFWCDYIGSVALL